MNTKASKTEAPEASNAVLFHMMNYYKRKFEQSDEELQSTKRRMKVEEEIHTEHIRNLEAELNQRIVERIQLGHANFRGSQIILRKHQAGIRMLHCIDELAAAIELVEDTRIGGENNMGVHYIAMEKNKIMQRVQVAMQIFSHDPDSDEEENAVTRWENEISPQLVTNIIDLTGEETQEELDGEETESDTGF